MPRKKPRDDGKAAEERASDRALQGTWWRCATHGLTQDAIVLGDGAYCPADDCSQAVRLAHSAMQDVRPDTDWTKTADRKGPMPYRGRRQARIDETSDDVVAEELEEAGEGSRATEDLVEDEAEAQGSDAEPAGDASQTVRGAEEAPEENPMAEQRTARAIIEEALRGAPDREWLTRELAELVAGERPEISKGSTDMALRKLEKAGVVRRLRPGVWRLAETDSAHSVAEDESGMEGDPAASEAPAAELVNVTVTVSVTPAMRDALAALGAQSLLLTALNGEAQG